MKTDEIVATLIGIGLATALTVGGIAAFHLVKRLAQRIIHGKEPKKIIQSVSVEFEVSNGEFGEPKERSSIQRFARRLDRKLRLAKAGEYDGDEFGAGTATLFFFGDNADQLWECIEDEIRHHAPLPALSATLLYGDYRSRRKTIDLSH